MSKEVKDYLEKYIIHQVFDNDDDGNTRISYHTHGLNQYGAGIELELLLPIPPKMAGIVLFAFAKEIIDKDRNFQDGELVYDLFNLPAKIRLLPSYDGSSDDLVYRIVLPDENVRFPGDAFCDKDYEHQETTERKKSNEKPAGQNGYYKKLN